MRRGFLRAAIPIPIGIAVGLMVSPVGWAIALFGVVLLVLAWSSRDDRPIDPVLRASIDEAMKLEKSDPATTARLLDRAVTDADRREEQERRPRSAIESCLRFFSRFMTRLPSIVRATTSG
jgi:hypothetical protein